MLQRLRGEVSAWFSGLAAARVSSSSAWRHGSYREQCHYNEHATSHGSSHGRSRVQDCRRSLAVGPIRDDDRAQDCRLA